MRNFQVLCALGLAMVGLSWGAVNSNYRAEGLLLLAYILATGLVAWLASRVAPAAPKIPALVVVALVAVAVRAIAVSEPPLLSTDVYRYVWDGRVQAAGINPYLYIPADPALAHLRDAAIYPRINRADYAHTAYPPFAQMFFYLATRLGDSLWAMRVGLLACEALLVAELLRLLAICGRSPTLVVAYVWHPLPIWEIANGSHVDALVALTTLASLLALLSGRRLLGLALLAGGALTKPYVAVATPAFWRPWDWRGPALFVAVAAALYLPYLAAGSAVFGFIPGYLHEEGLVDGNGFWLVSLIRWTIGDASWLEPAYFALALACLGLLVWRTSRLPQIYEPRHQLRDAAAFLLVAVFFVSPTYPWYYLTLAPFVALVGGPLIWVATIFASTMIVVWPDSSYPHVGTIWKSAMYSAWLVAIVAGYVYSRAREAGDSETGLFDRILPIAPNQD